MKKFILALVLGIGIAASSQGQQFRSFPFLAPPVSGGYNVTNASCALCYTSASWAGIVITNAASGTLGGFTNILSFGAPGTNTFPMTWTNHYGLWVIPTNGAITVANTAGLMLTTNDSTQLVNDIPLWTDREGRTLVTVTTNNWQGDGTAYAISPATLSCRISGAASAANTLNLIFVGLPDGTNEMSGAATAIPSFQWGITAAAGVTVVSTNFPTWKFAGCGKIRLRSATLTTTTAANIAVTLQDLRLNGFPP